MIRRKLFVAGLLVAALGLAADVPAQVRRTAGGARTATAASQANAGLESRLPASDGVVLVEMRRVLNEGVPRVFAGDTARVATVNADLDRFRAQTGIDPRAVERVAVGGRFVELPSGALKIDAVVALASGVFDERAIVAALRQTSGGGAHREQKHGGKTMHVFTLNQSIRMFGISPNMRVSELAVSALDAGTIAVGDPVGVRAAIDAGAGRGRVSPALLALARQTPNALVSFASSAPRALLRRAEGLGNPAIEQSVASIRQMYGSLGASANGFELLAAARTASPESAKQLSETLTALKSLAGFAASQLQGDRQRLARAAAENLQVAVQGSDVRLTLSVPQADMPALLNAF